MNDDQHTIQSGHLDVGDGHKIYYQQWGNPDKKPIFFLHGGPGSGLKDHHKLTFDPEAHHVIFHDQRGCGSSTPFGKLEANNTDALVNDIEMLRNKLTPEAKITLFGGSWGSCLALVYAINYPDNVHKMLLNGIYTGTKQENDYIQQGGLSTHFPESWQQYIEVVPKDRRDDTVTYYLEMMRSKDKEIADDHVRRWNINEGSASKIDPDIKGIVQKNQEVKDSDRSVALIEAHYFSNNMFMPEDHIITNADKLRNIPIVFVHGRHDHVCPPATAYRLAKAIGDSCRLHIVPGSHAREGALREVVQAYAWSFLD